MGEHAGTTGDPDPFAATFSAWSSGGLDARIAGGESGHEVVGVAGTFPEAAELAERRDPQLAHIFRNMRAAMRLPRAVATAPLQIAPV